MVLNLLTLNIGDVGDYEAREHGTDYLDGMVFAPNQVIKLKFFLNVTKYTLAVAIGRHWLIELQSIQSVDWLFTKFPVVSVHLLNEKAEQWKLNVLLVSYLYCVDTRTVGQNQGITQTKQVGQNLSINKQENVAETFFPKIVSLGAKKEKFVLETNEKMFLKKSRNFLLLNNLGCKCKQETFRETMFLGALEKGSALCVHHLMNLMKLLLFVDGTIKEKITKWQNC